jgi:hypothetical protein
MSGDSSNLLINTMARIQLLLRENIHTVKPVITKRIMDNPLNNIKLDTTPIPNTNVELVSLFKA